MKYSFNEVFLKILVNILYKQNRQLLYIISIKERINYNDLLKSLELFNKQN